MKTFFDYLAESVKEYSFRIKTLVEIDEAFLDNIEKALRKYDIIDISAPKRLNVQKNPLDFPSVEGLADIYMVDVIVRVPASSAVMAQDIRTVTRLPDSQIVVRGRDEAIELVTTHVKASQDIEKEAKGRGLETQSLLQDSDYSEAQDVEVQVGDEYNQKFLNYLGQVAANREEVTFDNGALKKTSRFAWLKKEEAQDFNDGHDGVKPASNMKSGKKAIEPSEVHHSGVNQDTDKTFKKTFKDKNGEKTVVSKTAKQVRKD